MRVEIENNQRREDDLLAAHQQGAQDKLDNIQVSDCQGHVLIVLMV